MLKKGFVILISILLIISMCGNVNAAELRTSLDVIQMASETKYLEDNQGSISKKIVESDPDTGEVTIELKISNTREKEEGQEEFENTEIYLMVSENIVLKEETITKYLNNIEELVSKIFNYNSKTKVGIIGITGTIRDTWVDEETGKLVTEDGDEGTVYGNVTNAEIVVELTDNLDTIMSGLENMNTSKTSYYTNLQAAIRLANNNYSDNTNKILISLYDDVPNIAIGVCSQVSASYYMTVEEAIASHFEEIATYTRNEILKLKTSNTAFLLLRPEDTRYNSTWYNSTTGEKLLDFDGSPYVQKLYGTIENPTHGKMYNFTDETIDQVITENIYEDVEKIINPDMNETEVVDYFPEEIVDNFDLSYVGDPSHGIISDSIDLENRTISWNIGTLKCDEVATLRYKLKIKDMQNTDLLNKAIATNEKVVLTYKDMYSNAYTIELTSSPIIQLSEIEEEEEPIISPSPEPQPPEIEDEERPISPTPESKSPEAKKEDDTTIKGILPQTGVGKTIWVASVIAIISASAILYKKYDKYKDIK